MRPRVTPCMRKSNRELAENLADKLRPRLVALLQEALEEERGADDEVVPRVPGISQADYERALAAVQRWSGGGRKKRTERVH